MQAILVIVPEKSFLTFCSLQDGGFWVFLELQFCYDPHVLPMLTAPMVCAPLCYIWSRKLFFNANPPVQLRRGKLGPGRLTPRQALNLTN